jgi:predicted dehydrogenase
VKPTKKFNVAVIGYGWASAAHIAAINATSRGRVTAIYSSRPHDLAALKSRHGAGITLFRDYEALLRSDDVDVVSICSCPELHPDQVIAAARAQKHFIVEKPIALTAAATHEVVRVVRASGMKGCVCFEGRFSAQFVATKALIDGGFLGTVHYGEFDYFHGIGPWYRQYAWNTRRLSGGSSLLSAGCHAISSLLLCMGNDVESVTSFTTKSRSETFSRYEYPTTSVTVVAFKDGRIGKVASVIDCLQPYYRHTHLVGSEGSLLDNRFYSRKIAGLNQGEWSTLAFPLLQSGEVKDHPYTEQFESFFAALERGEDMLLTNFKEALVTHRVVFAADLSAREKRPVRLDEIPDFTSDASADIASSKPQKLNGRRRDTGRGPTRLRVSKTTRTRVSS